MDTRTRTILLWSGGAILVIAGIVTLFLSFSGSEDTTTEVNAIYTNAALTLDAQVQTLQAEMLSATPNPALSSPTPTFTPFPSPTLQQQTLAVLPTSTFAAGGGVTGCDNSVYISDVTIPDGTLVTPGQAFTKTWRVSNTGTCAWTAAYQVIFLYGDIMGGKATAIGKVVNPGESADVSVVLTSTSASGTITGRWKLTNDKGQQFGDELTVVIKNSATATGTPFTPTITPTPTVTPVVIVVTATYTPTATTAAPTETPTPTPTP